MKFDNELDKKIEELATQVNSGIVYIIKEGNEIKAVDEEAALKNCLFPTLVKRAIKN